MIPEKSQLSRPISRRRGRLHPLKIAEIVARRRCGEGVERIARAIGCSSGTVVWHCLRAGVDPFDGGGRARNQVGGFSPREDALIVECEKLGMTHDAIARQLHRSRQSIRLRAMLLAVRANTHERRAA